MRAGIAKRLALGAILIVLTSAPSVADACSVCSTGREDENRVAFLLTTVFLSALPLAMIGGAIWWFRRRIRAMEKDESTLGAPDTARLADLLPGSL